MVALCRMNGMMAHEAFDTVGELLQEVDATENGTLSSPNSAAGVKSLISMSKNTSRPSNVL